MSIFLSVIEWVDPRPDEMIHRIPEAGSAEFKLGSQCIVRESQSAVFFRDGKAYDELDPGRHTLTTYNIPLLTGLLSIPFGGTSPFRCEVYFINHKSFVNMKWGIRDPVAFRDKDFGLIRLRGYGVYSMRIVDPKVFLNTIVGREARYSSDEISDYLRNIIVARMNDYWGESPMSVLDMPSQYTEMAQALRGILAGEFTKYGLELQDFVISAITPPDEVQKAIDQRSQLGVLSGKMDDLVKLGMAQALMSGGGASQGAATTMGLVTGAMIPGAIAGGIVAGTAQQSSSPAPAGSSFCPQCGTAIASDANFCGKCGHKLK